MTAWCVVGGAAAAGDGHPAWPVAHAAELPPAGQVAARA